MDHINPAKHAGPKVNGYLLQKQPDNHWRIFDHNGDYTLHEVRSLGQAVMVARMNQPSH